jgi:hypothetical protein
VAETARVTIGNLASAVMYRKVWMNENAPAAATPKTEPRPFR